MNIRSTLYYLVAVLALSGVTCAPEAPQETSTRSPFQGMPEEQRGFNDDGFVPAPIAPQPLQPLIMPNQPMTPGVVAPNLKERIDGAIEHIGRREIYTSYGFWTVLHAILGLGPNNAYLADQTDSKTGRKIKALDFICDGGDMIGLKFNEHKDGSVDVVTNAGSGFFQGHQDQFIAEMAQWNMPKTRVFMVNGHKHTFDDFLRFSKSRINLNGDQELSWSVLIIGQFYGTDYHWKNGGEDMSLDDVVRYEIRNPIAKETVCGGTHRLFDLTWVYYLHRANGGKKEGIWKDVAEYLDKYKLLARKYQNGDGAFSTKFFIEPGNDPDPNECIRTTGHTFEWLLLALTENELKEPWVQNAADALSKLILSNRSMPLDGGSVYHAVHGLQIYRSRVFKTDVLPFIPEPPKE